MFDFIVVLVIVGVILMIKCGLNGFGMMYFGLKFRF